MLNYCHQNVLKLKDIFISVFLHNLFLTNLIEVKTKKNSLN